MCPPGQANHAVSIQCAPVYYVCLSCAAASYAVASPAVWTAARLTGALVWVRVAQLVVCAWASQVWVEALLAGGAVQWLAGRGPTACCSHFLLKARSQGSAWPRSEHVAGHQLRQDAMCGPAGNDDLSDACMGCIYECDSHPDHLIRSQCELAVLQACTRLNDVQQVQLSVGVLDYNCYIEHPDMHALLLLAFLLASSVAHTRE